MGFFKKLWNFVSGKGWQDEEELLKKQEEQQYEEDRKEKLREAESLKPDIQEERIVSQERPIKQQQKPTLPKKSEEVENARIRYEGKGSLTKVQERLFPQTVGTIDFQPTSDMGILKGVYNKLIEKSTISPYDKNGNPDQALIDVLIENRNKLQHRFTAEIRIVTDGGEGYMSIDGILAEHLNGIYDFIQIGATYTSQELQEAMNQAQAYFEKQYGSIGGNIRPPMNKKVTVQDLQIRMTFA